MCDLHSDAWKDVVKYSPDSPSGLVWSISAHGRSVGGVAGFLDGRGYWRLKYKQKTFRVHRIICALHFGSVSALDTVDHIDGDTKNNRLENLRIVCHATNMRNLKRYSNNSSGVTGVVFRDADSYPRYVAYWKDNDFKLRSKSFSLSVYGDKALSEAIKYREFILRSLKGTEFEFSDRHGKEFAEKLGKILYEHFPHSMEALNS